MSLRSVTRAPPKRMLVYFEADGSTSILSTNKVKNIIGGGNKLEEGAVVIADFDNVDYEALVIKLHDDPTVLSQHEIDFVMAQQFGKDDVDDNATDKENQPSSKRIKLTPKQARKEVKPKKQKDKSKAKPKAQTKKIITIESEVIPLECLSTSSGSDPSTEKVENKPGCLKFLDPLEQVRVQRLLDSFKIGAGKEMATQTEPVASSVGPSDNEAPKKIVKEKCVQTEIDVPVPSCHCKDVLASLNLLHQKIDRNSSLQVPKWTELPQSIHFEHFNCNDNSYEFVGNDSPLPSPVLPLSPIAVVTNAETKVQQDQPLSTSTPTIQSSLEVQPLSTSTPTIQSSLEVQPPSTGTPTIQSSLEVQVQPPSTSTPTIQSSLEVQPPSTSTPTIQSSLEVQPPSTSTPTIQSSLEVQPLSTSTPAMRSALFEETFRESTSMGNYAKNLVFKLFARHELEGSNCVGVKGKKSLEKDQRMEFVKEATFKKYSVEDKKKSWGLCRKAIDSAIRHLKPLQ